MSLTTSASVGDCAPAVQMEFFSTPSLPGAPGETIKPNGEPVRSRVREPEFSFPDPEDTQLALLPYEPCNDEEFTDNESLAFHEEAIRDALHSLADGRAS